MSEKQFIIRKGFFSLQDSQITGSLNVSGSIIVNNGITGSTDFNTLANKPTLISSSQQISTNISGAFNGITGSFVKNNLTDDSVQYVSGSIELSGDIIAKNYIVRSTVTQMTTSFSSGSTIFGDTHDDTHQFTGSLLITGSSFFNGDVQILSALRFGGTTNNLGAISLYGTANGIYSISQGDLCIASASYSFARGFGSIVYENAIGGYAGGFYCNSIGQYSYAIGQNANAQGNYSFAIGRDTVASGLHSFSTGIYNSASGDYSHAEGHLTVAGATYSKAIGSGVTVFGEGSFGSGLNNHLSSTALYSSVFGQNISGSLPYTLYSTNQIVSGSVEITGSQTLIGQFSLTGSLKIYNSGSIEFDANTAAPTTHQEGRLYYDQDDKTLALQTDVSGTTLQIGQEMFVRVVNKTGTQINDGEVCYISGSQGNRPKIWIANATGSHSHNVIGVATSNIADNNNGYITTQGLVRGLNTSAFNEGDMLWLSSTGGGQFTNVEPTAPTHKVKVGYCVVSDTTNGIILVHVDTGNDLSDLHDILITNPQANDTIVRSGSVWINQPLSTAVPTQGFIQTGSIGLTQSITGSLIVSGSQRVTGSLDVTGNITTNSELVATQNFAVAMAIALG